jgi:signal transduction histidine kinase
MHIVYNLVTQTLKGEMECISTPGKGTTFLIRILLPPVNGDISQTGV